MFFIFCFSFFVLQAVKEMAQRQKQQQEVKEQPPPSGPNGELLFQQGINQLQQDEPGDH